MAFTTTIFTKLAKVKKILGLPPIPNFVQILKKKYKKWMKFHLRPEVKYSFHGTDFTTIYNPSRVLCRDHLHQILPTSSHRCENKAKFNFCS